MLSFGDIYRLLAAPAAPTLSTSDFVARVSPAHGHGHAHTAARCTLATTLRDPVSRARDFDLSQCAEYGWFLPAPIVLCALVGVWQCVAVYRGKWGAGMERTGASRRKMWAKVVSREPGVDGAVQGGGLGRREGRSATTSWRVMRWATSPPGVAFDVADCERLPTAGVSGRDRARSAKADTDADRSPGCRPSRCPDATRCHHQLSTIY